MPPIVIAQLIAQFGPPAFVLIQKLIAIAEAQGTVSSTDFATLIADCKTAPVDHLNAVATAAGIPLTDPRVVALAALLPK